MFGSAKPFLQNKSPATKVQQGSDGARKATSLSLVSWLMEQMTNAIPGTALILKGYQRKQFWFKNDNNKSLLQIALLQNKF